MTPPVREDLLKEAETAIGLASWQKSETPDGGPGFTMYDGKSGDWILLAVGVETENGSRFDGTASRGGIVMRLPKELAEKAFKTAKEKAK